MENRGLGRQVCLAAMTMGVVALAASADAQLRAVPCRPAVTYVPFTIATPGVYCLVHNLALSASSGTAITITTDNVVLDLRGYTLDGSAAGAGTEAIGIASTGPSNVTVMNGTVRGFHTAIRLTATPGNTRGNIVQGIRAEGNTVAGISAGGIGAVIRDNLVVDTGGSTIVMPSIPRATGISAFLAPGGVIRNNDVVDTATNAMGSFDYGISAANSDGIVIEGNRVRNPNPSPAYSFGIIVPFSQNVQVVDNRIAGAETGVEYSSGATGKYRDNLTDGVAFPFSGTGTDAGGNN
jgi:hypothetical protein